MIAPLPPKYTLTVFNNRFPAYGSVRISITMSMQWTDVVWLHDILVLVVIVTTVAMVPVVTLFMNDLTRTLHAISHRDRQADSALRLYMSRDL